MISDNMQKIINKLHRIDSQAAEYVRNRCLQRDIYEVEDEPGVVAALFGWSFTPQGWDYWNNIYAQYRNLPNITKLGNEL